MSCGSSRESLRRFAREIMPAFAAKPGAAQGLLNAQP
jgi:hypothetical protein